MSALGRKRSATTEIAVTSEDDVLKITPLGAGNEVGRSCIVVEYKGKTVMLDCGIHPAYNGLAALPFFDEIDPASVDVLLVTHFHLDHAASLPYFLEKTTFRGRVYMTHPTRAIYKWLLSDYVRVSNVGADDQLYDETDLLKSYEKITAIDYHQEVEVNGIKFTGYNAGHVLGAAMFLIEIAGVKILYTGDYSREEDRHLMAAERPQNVTPDVLICESTYGVQSHEPRLEREARFTGMVSDIVTRGGRCLIPVFALGRAQELLLILDEYWQAHPELHSVPIYYASSLAKKCMSIYQTFINMMNARIRKQAKENNPFIFKHISNLKSMEHFDDVGPCVMMASPGMLQSGLSRELLELWCIDKRNGVVIPGYVVEGTLGKHILSEPAEIVSMSGAKLPLRMSVHYVSFSAHVDYAQNSAFIEEVGAPHLVLVHGDGNEMHRLRLALQAKHMEGDRSLSIYTPRNCETVELVFRGEKTAKILGSLAAQIPTKSTPVSGLLIHRDYQYHVVAESDLAELTDLRQTTIATKLVVPFRAPWELLVWGVSNMWGDVELLELSDKEHPSIRVFDAVNVRRLNERSVVLEWEADPLKDLVADSVMAVVLQMESCPASVKATTSPCSHSHGHEEHAHEDHCHGTSKDEDETQAPSENLKITNNELVRGELGKTTYTPKGFSWYMTKFLSEQLGESLTYAGQEMLDSKEVEEASGSKSEPLHRWKAVVDKEEVEIAANVSGHLSITAGNEITRKRLETMVGRIQMTLLPVKTTVSFGENIL